MSGGGTDGLPSADMEDTGVPGSDLLPAGGTDEEEGGGDEALLPLGFSEDPWEEGALKSPSALDGDLPASLLDLGVSRGLGLGLGEGCGSDLG